MPAACAGAHANTTTVLPAIAMCRTASHRRSSTTDRLQSGVIFLPSRDTAPGLAKHGPAGSRRLRIGPGPPQRKPDCRPENPRASFPDLKAPGGSATLASDPEVTMSATRTLTLADVAAPRAGTLFRTSLLIVGASLVTAARGADRDPPAVDAGADHRPDVRRAAVAAPCSARAARSSRRCSIWPRARAVCRCSRAARPAARARRSDRRLPVAFPFAARRHRLSGRARLGSRLGHHVRGHAARQHGDLRARPRAARRASCPPSNCSARGPRCRSSRATSSSRRSRRLAFPAVVEARRAGLEGRSVSVRTIAVLGRGHHGPRHRLRRGARRLRHRAPGHERRRSSTAGVDDIDAILEKGVATGKVADADAIAARKRLEPVHHARGRGAATRTW